MTVDETETYLIDEEDALQSVKDLENFPSATYEDFLADERAGRVEILSQDFAPGFLLTLSSSW